MKLRNVPRNKTIKRLSAVILAAGAFMAESTLNLESGSNKRMHLVTFAEAQELSMSDMSLVVGKKVAQAALKYPQLDSQVVANTIIMESLKVGLDPLLVAAIIQHESRFDTSTIGGHGEIGLMQIRPITARWIALRSGITLKKARDLHNPVLNIKIGVRYLAWLNSRYTDVRHTIAAYNMGPLNVRRVLKQGLMPKIYYEKVLNQYHESLNLLSAKDTLVSYNF